MASTDFQKEKLQRIYKMKDLSGDGKVTLEDFTLWGQKVAENSNLEYTPDRKKAWEEAFATFFPNDVGITEEGWIKSICEFMEGKNAIEIATTANVALFNCIDVNPCDGMISLEEFKGFIQPLGVINEESIKIAFDAIDTNKDGVLSKEEFGSACAHYYFDVEDTPFKHFYGMYE